MTKSDMNGVKILGLLLVLAILFKIFAYEQFIQMIK
jgi:hypothetical protein